MHLDHPVILLSAVVFSVPVLVGVLSAFSILARHHAASVIGTISPFLIAFVIMLLGFVVRLPGDIDIYAMSLVRTLTILSYVGLVIIGIGLSFVSWPVGIAARFTLSAAVGFVACLLFPSILDAA